MQDRYVGDIGDFGKYGLLRTLTGGEPSLRLGIVWYLHQDESHNDDGKFVDYLDGSTTNKLKFRACDPGLYDSLQQIVLNGCRNINAIEGSGILPPDTLYYNSAVSYPPDMPKRQRNAWRHRWMQLALASTENADMVFFDPDNGISTTVDPMQKNGGKFTYVDDMRHITGRGQSLAVYHHLSRQGNANEQIKRAAELLESCLQLPVWSLWYHRGSARCYFIIGQKRHAATLESGLASFLGGEWSNHFEIVGKQLPADITVKHGQQKMLV